MALLMGDSRRFQDLQTGDIGRSRGLYGRLANMAVPVGKMDGGLDAQGRGLIGGAGDDSMFHRATQMSLIDPEMMAGEAGMDQQMATSRGMEGMKRDLQRYGINPNSGRFAGLMQKATLQGAADRAGAQTRARMEGRDMNAARSIQMAGAENARNSLKASTGLGLLSAARSRTGQELEAARLRSSNLAAAAGGMRATAADSGALAYDAQMAKELEDLEIKKRTSGLLSGVMDAGNAMRTNMNKMINVRRN